MIKIAETGNTIIRVATGGVKVKGGTQWTVYPLYVSDPTLQRFTREQQRRAEELNITGFREKGDFSGHRMNKDLSEAIARLRRNLGLDQYKDLGFVANRIDISPKGEIAKLLETEYDIKPLEKESQFPPEVKG